MKLFSAINGLSDDKQHDKFKFLRDEVQLIHEKMLLSSYTNGLVDRDHKMVREFQETFHSTYWEIILYQLCVEQAGFVLDQTHPFPDFIIKKPIEFYIEAVVANIKQTGAKENERTLYDQFSMLTPPHSQKDFSRVLDESIIRSSNAISAKFHKYNEYKKADWIDERNPFIIALSSCDQINYGREFIYPMLALLYGRYYVPSGNGSVIKSSITKQETGTELPLGFFMGSDYRDISAIIYTCTNTFGKLTALALSKGLYTSNGVIDVVRDIEDESLPFKFREAGAKAPETISDGIFVFHNPYAKNPVDPKMFEKTNVTHYFFDGNKIKTQGLTTPLFSRLSVNKVLVPYLLQAIMENEFSLIPEGNWNKITLETLIDMLQQ